MGGYKMFKKLRLNIMYKILFTKITSLEVTDINSLKTLYYISYTPIHKTKY